MLKRIVVALALALVALGTPAHADAVGPRFQVNTYKNSYQDRPAVAALKTNGGFVVTWRSNGQDGSGNGIYGQIYTAAGVRFGGEFRVNTVRQGEQSPPSVTAVADGGFVVAWSSSDGGGYGIYGQRYSAAGVRKGGEFRINTITRYEQVMPSVASLRDGGFIIVWNSYNEALDTALRDVFGQRYNAAGQRVGGEFKISSRIESYDTANVSRVAGLASGGFVVTWVSHAPGRRGIYAQRYNAKGVTAGGPFKVAAASVYSWGLFNSSVAGLKNGTFVVTWEDDHDFNSGTFAHIFAANGTPLGTRFQANTAGHTYSSSLASLANGGFVVAWVVVPDSANEVYGQRFSANGRKVGTQFAAGAPPGAFGQGNPSVASLRDGGFVLTWSDDELVFEDYLGVFGQRFNP